MRTSLVIDKKTGQRRVVLVYKTLFLFFSNGIVCLDVTTDIIQSFMTCTLIIKQVLLKYIDSYIFNWHWKCANCLTWPKVDVLPYFWDTSNLLSFFQKKWDTSFCFTTYGNIVRLTVAFSCSIIIAYTLNIRVDPWTRFMKNIELSHFSLAGQCNFCLSYQ